MKRPAYFLQVAGAAVVLGIVSLPAAPSAVEIGTDAGINYDLSSTRRLNIRFAFPAYDGVRSPMRQYVRVGFPVGGKGVLEMAPSFDVSRRPYQFSRSSITSEALAVTVSYLGGRTDGPGAAPYFRVGAHGKLFHSSVGDSFFSARTETQVGLSWGGGARWRLGRVIGVRAELVATRWLDGDYIGYWDLGVRGGVSAFTR